MPQIKMIQIFSLIFFSILDNMDSSRLLVAGDFNIALGPLDYHGSLARHSNVNSRDILRHLWMKLTWLIFGGLNILASGNIPGTRITPFVLSRLNYIFASNNLVNNVKSSTISDISSDHSIVTAKISNDIPVRGKGYWKFNCHYLRPDAHSIDFIKS